MAKTSTPERAQTRQFLTRRDMERIITNEKGSVLWGGQIISKVEDLPTDTDLAIGDPAAEAAQARTIDQQIEALEREKARLATVKATRLSAMQEQDAAADEAEEKPTRGRKARKATGARRGRKPKGAAEAAGNAADQEAPATPTASAGPAGGDDEGEGAAE